MYPGSAPDSTTARLKRALACLTWDEPEAQVDLAAGRAALVAWLVEHYGTPVPPTPEVAAEVPAPDSSPPLPQPAGRVFDLRPSFSATPAPVAPPPPEPQAEEVDAFDLEAVLFGTGAAPSAAIPPTEALLPEDLPQLGPAVPPAEFDLFDLPGLPDLTDAPEPPTASALVPAPSSTPAVETGQEVVPVVPDEPPVDEDETGRLPEEAHDLSGPGPWQAFGPASLTPPAPVEYEPPALDDFGPEVPTSPPPVLGWKAILGLVVGVATLVAGAIVLVQLLSRQSSPKVGEPVLSVPSPPPAELLKPPPSQTQSPPAAAPAPSPGATAPGATTPVPNLANREFPDLSNLSAATPKPSPSPTAAPQTAAELGDFFYVVMDYTGEADLNRARQAVPQAFLWRFPPGLKIQMGAFETRNQAQTMVNQLKQKGLNAQVYPPR